jgi:hypothetical protein
MNDCWAAEKEASSAANTNKPNRTIFHPSLFQSNFAEALFG